MGERWARFVTRHPLRTVALGVAALLVLAIPALSMRLALADNQQRRSRHDPASGLRPDLDPVRSRLQRPR